MERKQRVPMIVMILMVCGMCLFAVALTMCHKALAEQSNAYVASPEASEGISQREVPTDEIIYYSVNYSVQTEAVSGDIPGQNQPIDAESTESPDVYPQVTAQPAPPEATKQPHPSEITEEVTAPEITAEPTMPETTQNPVRSIVVTDNIGDTVSFGDQIVLTAQLVGYDDVEVCMQWQVNSGSGWEDLPGEQGERYEFVLDQQNINYTFRLAVSVI